MGTPQQVGDGEARHRGDREHERSGRTDGGGGSLAHVHDASLGLGRAPAPERAAEYGLRIGAPRPILSLDGRMVSRVHGDTVGQVSREVWSALCQRHDGKVHHDCGSHRPG
nr:hypothetical protein GCM10025699_13950 [Microbacterium flavescens]